MNWSVYGVVLGFIATLKRHLPPTPSIVLPLKVVVRWERLEIILNPCYKPPKQFTNSVKKDLSSVPFSVADAFRRYVTTSGGSSKLTPEERQKKFNQHVAQCLKDVPR